ncbi:MAG: shikimate kinase [Bacillota bacterium]|nr:shikimate kinase [Bacillota bacterium]
MNNKNIVMIGMPSSGKTTVGKLISDIAGKAFLDTDQLFYDQARFTPKDYVNNFGLDKFLNEQEKIIIELSIDNTIIATGGGVIHNNLAMNHLKENGIIVYLDTEFSVIEKRISSERRFARKDGKSFYDMYLERVPLYKKYADIIIECNEMTSEDIANELFIILNKQL